jgi:hypothetical protein
MFIDNTSLAIMTRLNELAERYGISPIQFSASLDSDEDGQRILHFALPPEEPEAGKRFVRMLADLGITDDDVGTIKGSDTQLYATLEQALQRAPKAASHRR